MNIKYLSTFLIASLASFSAFSTSAAAPKITIKSELSSPVVLENSQDKNYLRVSLTGFNQETQKRSPINLVLVIDRSASMSGDRIEKARDAAILAINMLNPDDTIAIVAYDNEAEVIVHASKVKDKTALIEKVKQHITPRGMTALFAGVSRGIGQVEKYLNADSINRIILLSDGQANKGPTSISDLSGLARLAAKKGVSITTIGLGSDYNEDLMTAIANYSDGNHAFVDNAADLENAFQKEFTDVMSVVAQNVTVTITTDKAVKPVRLLGRDGSISGNVVTVKLNQLYANQDKYVLLEVIPAKGVNEQSMKLADVNVSYNNLSSKKDDKFDQAVNVRYSKSKEAVSKAVVEDVLVESEIQKVALANEEAIKLMDAGKKKEAKAMMDASANSLNSLQVTSPASLQKAKQNAQAQQDLSDSMEKKATSTYRKSVKESNYKTQKQQY